MHPLHSTTMQQWNFESDSVIRVGRAEDNSVVLYSSVVSRYHIEIRRQSSGWEIVGLGTNGTYVDGQLIAHAPIIDGIVVRLAASGPKLLIRIDESESDQLNSSQSPGQEVRKLPPPLPTVVRKPAPRKTFLAPPPLE